MQVWDEQHAWQERTWVKGWGAAMASADKQHDLHLQLPQQLCTPGLAMHVCHFLTAAAI